MSKAYFSLRVDIAVRYVDPRNGDLVCETDPVNDAFLCTCVRGDTQLTCANDAECARLNCFQADDTVETIDGVDIQALHAASVVVDSARDAELTDASFSGAHLAGARADDAMYLLEGSRYNYSEAEITALRERHVGGAQSRSQAAQALYAHATVSGCWEHCTELGLRGISPTSLSLDMAESR